MEIIKLNENNIKNEHICCAISDKKCLSGYNAKKDWLKTQFKEGYVFKKFDVRGKVFIEYVPIEKSWAPIIAPNYMLINCFWVSGKYKGKGHGKALFQECENDAMAKQMNGIVVVAGNTKKPFMSDKVFFKKQGFELADTALPYFELWFKPFSETAPKPKFKDIAKNGKCDIKDGVAVYYTNACPFTDYYVQELADIAKEKGIKISVVKLTKEQAQNHFVPHTIYSVFRNGEFITQHIINRKHFDKFINL